jgi:hypothetical protein
MLLASPEPDDPQDAVVARQVQYRKLRYEGINSGGKI